LTVVPPWVIEETHEVDLEDKRLNDRLLVILAALGEHPMASIPAACNGYAEMAAAYRFFENEKVTFERILSPHIAMTRRRIAAPPIALLVQDTTEIDMTRPQQEVQGAGPLDGDTRRGALLHLLHAFTPDGTPLGTAHADLLVRSDDKPLNRTKSRAERQKIPIEEKESHRWLIAFRQAQEEARRHPQTRIVCIGDSEADIYELLVEATAESNGARWIVRACQDRALQPDAVKVEKASESLRERLLAAPVRFEQKISIRGRDAKVSCEVRGRRQARISRAATVVIRAARVTLRPPYRHDRKLPVVSVNVVYVLEKDVPDGEPAVEWILLTDLPIDTLDQVREAIQYYCGRWMIEIFFKTLKSGCRVEKRRFEHIDRLLPCLAVYLIVAWRTLYLCRLGRACPEMTCEAVFEPAEWQSVYQVVHRAPPPRKPPTLQQMIRTIAQLGGYVNRRRDDEPGPQTVALGMQRLHDITLCWKLFGPGARLTG
jgi:hypothetical protein